MTAPADFWWYTWHQFVPVLLDVLGFTIVGLLVLVGVCGVVKWIDTW